MKARPERFPLRVVRGGFQPADQSCARRLADDKGIRVGDLVFAQLTKPRNPRFHRLAHALGRLIAENIQAFDGMDAHRVLKRLQYESEIGCETAHVRIPGMGAAEVRWPRSLAFESMDEGEFHEVLRGLCRHVAAEYWTDLDEERIADMAELMVHE